MKQEKHPNPSSKELVAWASALIDEQSTMTLATANGNAAWAAPVYFAFHKACFYFFSDPASRHVREALEGGQASAAIYCAASSWQGIRGIQMSGQILAVSPGLEAVRAIRVYLKRFPFTKEFFEAGQAMDLESFAKRFRVRLYKFRPQFIYYSDNEIRFGFRERIEI